MFDTYSDIFAQRADAYHSAMLRWPRARDAEFEAVLAPLDGVPDGLLFDMPSGGGYLGAYVRPGMRYLAIEPANDFFEASAEKRETLNAQITDVSLPDGAADYIVSLAGLHHEPDLPRVFAEMRRLVKPGGRVVIADAAEGTPSALFLNGYVADHNPLGHDGRFLDGATAGLLRAAGFEIVDDALTPMPWAFTDKAEGGAFCRQLFGMTLAEPDQVAEALERDIGFDAQGRLNWALRRIVCDAA